MSSCIKNLKFEEKEISVGFLSTLTQTIWEFDLDGKKQIIELYESKWSGKKKIVRNGVVECDLVDQGAFLRSFDLFGHNCSVVQYGEKNELRIDNQSFTHLYNLERNQNFFKQNTGPISTSYSTKPVSGEFDDKNNTVNSLYHSKNQKIDNRPILFDFKIKPADQSNHQSRKFEFKSPKVGQSSTNMQNLGNNLLELNGNANMQDTNQQNSQKQSTGVNDLLDIFGGGSQEQSNNNNNNNMNMNMDMNVNVNVNANANTTGNSNNNNQMFDLMNLNMQINNPPHQGNNSDFNMNM